MGNDLLVDSTHPELQECHMTGAEAKGLDIHLGMQLLFEDFSKAWTEEARLQLYLTFQLHQIHHPEGLQDTYLVHFRTPCAVQHRSRIMAVSLCNLLHCRDCTYTSESADASLLQCQYAPAVKQPMLSNCTVLQCPQRFACPLLFSSTIVMSQSWATEPRLPLDSRCPGLPRAAHFRMHLRLAHRNSSFTF